jgi:hypothetical protein
MKYQVMLMSFDGDFQIEKPEFDTIEKAWDYSNDLGSRWFFYPFHFVISKNTIRDSINILDWTINKRIKTVSKRFNEFSKQPEAEGMGTEEYMFAV